VSRFAQSRLCLLIKRWIQISRLLEARYSPLFNSIYLSKMSNLRTARVYIEKSLLTLKYRTFENRNHYNLIITRAKIKIYKH